jgi:hypothetical protein
MELPFKLYDNHKSTFKRNWKRIGLIMNNFDEIYNKYIYATHCELCNKQFPNTKDRQMEHDHKTGEFRNIVCRRCNQRKADVKIQCNNTSGYVGISKHIDIKCKQGYYWEFKAVVDGKHKLIKKSIDYDKLVAFADKWKIDNNYNT